MRIRQQYVLMTAEVDVFNHITNRYERVIIFFDNGSQLSFIEEGMTKNIGAKTISTIEQALSGMGGKKETFLSNIVEVQFRISSGRILKTYLSSKDKLTSSFHTAYLSTEDVKYIEESNYVLANLKVSGESITPSIIIGIDLWTTFIKVTQASLMLPSGLTIQPTVFGYAVQGSSNVPILKERSNCDLTQALTVIREENKDIRNELKNLYTLEGLGITENPESKDDETFKYMEKYSNQIIFSPKGVIAPFPLKDSIVELKDNFNIAYRRLVSLIDNLRGKPTQLEWYEKILKTYTEEGIIEIACENIVNRAGIFYLPHRGVWKAEKAVPLRIVFDASQKSRFSPSLNDCIFEGYSFINKTHQILYNARWAKILLMADIQAAFIQIRLPAEHRDLTRFLWVENPDKQVTKDNIKIYRFTRVPFGINASPSILNMTITKRMIGIGTQLATEILNNLYVDNVILEAETPEIAMEKYKDSKKYFQEIHMNLRDFLSSHSIVNHSIPDNDRTKPGPYKLLGLNYNIKTNSIEIEIHFPQVTSLTKRKVISLIHSVFDPIGITVPILVKHKLFLRNLFVNNLKWNDILQPDFISEWNSISMPIDGTVVSIPRHIGPSSLTNESELWVFADASKLVYACCAYISHRELGESSRLVSGKGKLTPTKGTISIPCLELIALLLGIRLAHSIVTSLRKNINKVYIVSDSKVALSWIISTRSLPIFVRNQVDRIKKLQNDIQSLNIKVSLFYIPSNQNPADVGTRGCSGKDIASSLWLNGPTWCSQTCDRWPLKEIHQIEGSDTCELQDEYPDEQLERNMYVHITNTVETRVVSEFPIKKFSTFIKLIRVVANMLLFVKLCVSKGIKRKVDIKLGIRVDDSTNITSELMDRAEIIIIRSETLHISIEEVKERFKDRVIIKDKDGLIRYRSRMQNADVTYDFKNPHLYTRYITDS